MLFRLLRVLIFLVGIIVSYSLHHHKQHAQTILPKTEQHHSAEEEKNEKHN